MEVNRTGPDSIYQDVPTVPGTVYTFSFAFRGRLELRTMDVTIGDRVLNVQAGAGAWSFVKGSITATSSTTRIEFDSTSGDRIGMLLDAVSFEEACCNELRVSPSTQVSSKHVADERYSVTLILAPGEHIARYIDQFFAGIVIYEDGVKLEGSMLVESDLPVAATALRMQLRPTLTLSTLPVTPAL